jgi:hypothetical protein
MARLAQLEDAQWQKSKHKTRHLISKEREHVYINGEHQTEKYTEALLGYWFATRIGRKDVSALVELACEAAGVARKSLYGHGLKL